MVFKTLFGGSDSSTGTSAVNVQSDKQKKIEGQLSDYLLGLLGKSNVPQTTSLDETSLAGLEQFALDSVAPQDQTAFNTQAQGRLSGLIGNEFDPNQFNEFFDTAVAQPTINDFFESTLPELENRFAGNQNFFGGDRIKASERAIDDLFSGLTQTRASLAQQERARADQTSLDALTQAQNISTLEQQQNASTMANLLALLGAGQQEEARTAESMDTTIAQLLSILNTTPFQTGSYGKTSQRDGIFKSIGLF